MSVDVATLLGFTRAAWAEAAAHLRAAAAGSEEQAEALRRAAKQIQQAWRDEIGDMIAERCREQADRVDAMGLALPRMADGLDDGAAEMVAASDALRSIIDTAEANHVVVTDSGDAYPRLDLSILDPNVLMKRAAFARAIESTVRAVLHRATLIDRGVATLLATALGLMAPPFDMGPLDLSDDGIRAAARATAQGNTNFCAWVAPLIALAESNPDFIREHLVWDPATQTYEVTIYDERTGAPIRVTVDPRSLPEWPADGMTQSPDFVSIYTQALRQTYPDVDSSDFGKTGRIVLGKDYTERSARDVSFDEIRRRLATDPPGSAMVATTNAPEPQPQGLPPGKTLQSGHAYAVVGFTDDGQIILRNPHGPGSASHTVTLTEDEYRRWLNGVMTWPAQ